MVRDRVRDTRGSGRIDDTAESSWLLHDGGSSRADGVAPLELAAVAPHRSPTSLLRLAEQACATVESALTQLVRSISAGEESGRVSVLL